MANARGTTFVMPVSRVRVPPDPFGGDVAQLVEQGTSRNPLSPRFIQNGARTSLRAPFHFGSADPSYDRRSRTLLYLREAPKIGPHIRGLYLVPVLADPELQELTASAIEDWPA